MNAKNTEKETILEPEIDLQQDPIPTNIPTEERIRIFANIIVDRILELQKCAVIPIEVKNK